jgi:hypothetical protein
MKKRKRKENLKDTKVKMRNKNEENGKKESEGVRGNVSFITYK